MSTRKKDILDLVICPITQTKLSYLTEKELAILNLKIMQGKMIFLNGKECQTEIEAAFIGEKLGLIYPIIGDINYLLPKYALIEKDNQEVLASLDEFNLGNQLLENFYEEFGWKKSENNNYNDAEVFEDLRDISHTYVHKCHMRVKNFIPSKGKYLLDAASGPIQFDEYLEYSKEYDYRVCMDLSSRALGEANRKLGDRGIYIIGNIANMPIRTGQIDAAISLNTIYHIPKEQQLDAFKEIHRVLIPGGPGVIVYEWGKHSHLINLFVLPYKIKTHIEKLVLRLAPKLRIQPDIYFHAYKQGYFSEEKLGFKMKTFVWRSISVPFMKMYIHKFFFGKQLLDLIYKIEDSFPTLAGNVGEYPMFYLKKA